MSNKKNKHAKVIHVEYTRVYHEVLKYEEVIDVDIDKIYQTYLKVLAEMRSIRNLGNVPTQNNIDQMVNMILNRIRSY